MHGARIDAGQSTPGADCTRPAETGDRMLFRGLQLRRIRPLLAAPSTACRLIHRRRGDHCLQLRHHRPAQVTADTSSIAVGTLTPTSRDTGSTRNSRDGLLPVSWAAT